jgi:hypothetical protein
LYSFSFPSSSLFLSSFHHLYNPYNFYVILKENIIIIITQQQTNWYPNYKAITEGLNSFVCSYIGLGLVLRIGIPFTPILSLTLSLILTFYYQQTNWYPNYKAVTEGLKSFGAIGCFFCVTDYNNLHECTSKRLVLVLGLMLGLELVLGLGLGFGSWLELDLRLGLGLVFWCDWVFLLRH